MNDLVVFPTFFNLSLNFAIRVCELDNKKRLRAKELMLLNCGVREDS